VFKGAKLGSLKLNDGSMLAADLTDAVFAEDQLRDAIRD
jgi:hypothetical protein